MYGPTKSIDPDAHLEDYEDLYKAYAKEQVENGKKIQEKILKVVTQFIEQNLRFCKE